MAFILRDLNGFVQVMYEDPGSGTTAFADLQEQIHVDVKRLNTVQVDYQEVFACKPSFSVTALFVNEDLNAVHH